MRGAWAAHVRAQRVPAFSPLSRGRGHANLWSGSSPDRRAIARAQVVDSPPNWRPGVLSASGGAGRRADSDPGGRMGHQ